MAAKAYWISSYRVSFSVELGDSQHDFARLSKPSFSEKEIRRFREPAKSEDNNDLKANDYKVPVSPIFCQEKEVKTDEEKRKPFYRLAACKHDWPVPFEQKFLCIDAASCHTASQREPEQAHADSKAYPWTHIV